MADVNKFAMQDLNEIVVIKDVGERARRLAVWRNYNQSDIAKLRSGAEAELDEIAKARGMDRTALKNARVPGSDDIVNVCVEFLEKLDAIQQNFNDTKAGIIKDAKEQTQEPQEYKRRAKKWYMDNNSHMGPREVPEEHKVFTGPSKFANAPKGTVDIMIDDRLGNTTISAVPADRIEAVLDYYEKNMEDTNLSQDVTYDSIKGKLGASVEVTTNKTPNDNKKADSTSAEKKSEVLDNGYDHVKALNRFKSKITAVQNALEAKKVDSNIAELINALTAYKNSPDAVTTTVLQEILVKMGKKVSKDGKADGKFGGMTMRALEGVAGIKSADVATTGGSAGRTPTWKGTPEGGVGESDNGIPSPIIPKDTPVALRAPESKDTLKAPNMSLISKDGAYYLTGPKGRPTRVEFQDVLKTMNLPKNAPEKLGESVRIVEEFALVLNAYSVKYPKKTAEHQASLKSVQDSFAADDIQSGKRVLNLIDAISKLRLGSSDEDEIQSTFEMQNPDKRHMFVLQFIRKELGQSDMVAKSIMSRHDIWVSDDEIMTGKLPSNELTASQRQKIGKVIDEAKIEAAKTWKDHKVEYIEAFKNANPGVTIDESRAEEWNKNLTVLTMAKREVFYQKLYNKDQSDSELQMLQNILGAKTFTPSDRAMDITGEVASMIAMEALAIGAGMITAWVGTVAINAAMLGRNAYRWVRAVEAYNTASKTRQAFTTAGRILGGGVGFEAGAATTRSLMENGDLTSMHSKEGYAQSIAMMGILKGVGTLIERGTFGKGIQFKEGAGFRKNILPFSGQVAIEGTAIFGTAGIVGQIMADGRDNWTPEQLAQAILMAAFFKGAGRVRISKKPNGEIGVEPEAPAGDRASEGRPRGDRIPEGTFDAPSNLDRHILAQKARDPNQFLTFPYSKKVNWLIIEKVESGEHAGKYMIQHPTNKNAIRYVEAGEITKHLESATPISNGTAPEVPLSSDARVYNPAEILAANKKFATLLETRLKWLKEGEEVSLGDAKIKKTGGRYEVTQDGQAVIVDDVNALSGQITGANRLNAMTEIGTKEMKARIAKLSGKEIEGTWIRIVGDGKGGFVLESKISEGVWKQVEIKDIPETSQNKILEKICGAEGLGMIRKMLTREKIDVVSPSEEAWAIKKIGKAAWDKIKNKVIGDAKELGGTTKTGATWLLSFITGIGRSQTGWGGAIIGAGVFQWVELANDANQLWFKDGWDKYKNDLNGKDVWEFLAEALLLRYIGFVRWTIVTAWYAMGMYHLNKTSTQPASQPIPPAPSVETPVESSVVPNTDARAELL